VRVFVTGLGAISALGAGVEALRRGLWEGRAAFRAPTVFDPARHRTKLAGEAERYLVRFRSRLSRADGFARAAAAEAVAAAGLEPPPDTGVFFGSSTGGMLESERFFDALRSRRRASLGWVASQENHGPGDAVARALGTRGPVETIASACAASTMAIGAALDGLRSGEIEVAIAGGADSLCQLTYAGFNALRAVDERPCRPFRADRAGLSIGEGAAALVLETEHHVRSRGALRLAELAGAGATCDAQHMTAPDPEGTGAAAAIERALADAGIGPDAIDFVNAHGTGTPLNDAAEAAALRRVFGRRVERLPVTSTKGAVGHLLGACGALEAVVTVLCLEAGSVHPTPGGGDADPALGLRVVLEAPLPVPGARCALSTNFAFGGANAALVLRRDA
jgi:3-oxoacyl-[acyl-carrier-protein] synthase II